MRFFLVLVVLLTWPASPFGFFDNTGVFKNSKYQVCFTPGDDCTQMIADAVESARKEILVQAYSFTSAPIAKAVVEAHNRGIRVRVILDKSQFSDRYSASKFLIHEKVPVWRDDTVAIAHNKVMVIDDEVVVTGSFNFTKAAQSKNAENVLIVTDKALAAKYKKNWYMRQRLSEDVHM